MRKIIKIISISLLIVCITIISWYLGLFERYNYFTAHWDILNKNVRIISMGKQDNHAEYNTLHSKYGFYNENLNCFLESKIQEKAVRQYNLVVKEYLKSRNGDNWELRYRKEYDALLKELNNEDFLKDILYHDSIYNRTSNTYGVSGLLGLAFLPIFNT